MKSTQVNVAMPQAWRTQLERLARILSVEEDRDLTYQDLIRQAVQEKYELKHGEEKEAEV